MLALTAAPPIAVALVALLLGLDVAPVTEWFWPTPTANVAEAAAFGDAARVRVLAGRGARLDVPLPVRPDLLDGTPPAISAAEAAIRRRSDALLEVLLELGLDPPAHEARRLYCLARQVEADDAADLLLDALRLSPVSCDVPPSLGDRPG